MKVAEQEKSSNEKIEENKLTENKPIKKRDISAELIRVIACLLVIGNHLCLQVYNVYDVQVDWSRLFQRCFLTDCIPLFFMLTGFFIANGRSYKKIWKKTAKNVLLPTFIFVIFTQIFHPFIINRESFMYCLKTFDLNIDGIITAVLKADVSYLQGLCDHLWYIFAYVKIIIWIPLLWLVCKNNKESNLARRIMISLGLLSLFTSDIQRFVTFSFGKIEILNLASAEILYVLLGYELFIHKDKFRNKKVLIVSLLLFGLINVAKYEIEKQYMIINHFYDIVGRENFLDWKYTILNVISSVSLFVFLYSFEIKNEKLGNLLVWLSDKTFGIYLIHYLILAKVDLYKFEKIGKVVYELIYMAVGLVVVFIASIIIVLLLRKIRDLTIKIFKVIINVITPKAKNTN